MSGESADNGGPLVEIRGVTKHYRRGAERYMLVVNASNVEKDFRWLRSRAPEACEVSDRSEAYALLALQGPRAQEILQPLTGVDLSSIAYYHFAEGEVDGHPATISRTGYTGEDGFEIFVAPNMAVRVWQALLDAGRSADIVPCGLGARDTLRLEAGMRLYGQDIDESTTVLEADLGWMVGWSKTGFIGHDALVRQRSNGPPRKLVGFEVLGRGIARHGHPVHLGDQVVGCVTSGTYAPYVKKNIGLCYLPAARSAVGTDFDIDVRGRRLPARVVPTPFYKRAR